MSWERARIVDYLSRGRVGASEATLARHLDALVEAGLVRVVRRTKTSCVYGSTDLEERT